MSDEDDMIKEIAALIEKSPNAASLKELGSISQMVTAQQVIITHLAKLLCESGAISEAELLQPILAEMKAAKPGSAAQTLLANFLGSFVSRTVQ
ncbi:hypothetical protein KBX73_10200 [Acetobacter persici]|uniref:hypothetical protein n=1 Tax=Acetobacter persici TaxID=1076596 RepID=UPI0020CE4976|nr:hypothetical protein [Acetobacter persici]MCP9320136.1 hypothetical protein [Acetobacter persici]